MQFNYIKLMKLSLTRYLIRSIWSFIECTPQQTSEWIKRNRNSFYPIVASLDIRAYSAKYSRIEINKIIPVDSDFDAILIFFRDIEDAIISILVGYL